MNVKIRMLFLMVTLLSLQQMIHADDKLVELGLGSYTTTMPSGQTGPPDKIYKSSAVTGPMQTNDWWSSAAFEPLSSGQYPHPFAVKSESQGLRVDYPKVVSEADSFSATINQQNKDFIIGHSDVSDFKESLVDGFDDWFVKLLYQDGSKSMNLNYGHGSPYIYVTYEGGGARLTFSSPPTIWSGDANSSILGITINKHHYALFAPEGTKWTGQKSAVLINDLTSDKNYLSIALLPDNKKETLDKFSTYAYSFVTDTKVKWVYDEEDSEVKTTYTYETEAMQGTQTGTIFALYPHQWRNTSGDFLKYTYETVRGKMKVKEGNSFETTMKYTGILPYIPKVADLDKNKLTQFLKEEESANYGGRTDMYWIGKRIGKLASMAPIADEIGENGVATSLRNKIKEHLEFWFGATKASNKVPLYYNQNWGTIIGYPTDYGANEHLNDHHFHYGYFIKAAAEVARFDSDWSSDSKWGKMVELLISDIANDDRDSDKFPFLRNFDIYEGHSWASGSAAGSINGNNNESSSEGINAWAGMVQWGEVTGNKKIRDLGIYLYTTEMNAIQEYWFDVHKENFPKGFKRSTATMIYGGKVEGNFVWFDTDMTGKHAINWLPFTSSSLYLGQYPEYVKKNYQKLKEENGGSDFKGWGDLVWMYQALYDAPNAAKVLDKRLDKGPEDGNSKANTYYWINNLKELGTVEKDITANTPLYGVFKKGDKKSYYAYNASDTEITVKFSDGTEKKVPPKTMS